MYSQTLLLCPTCADNLQRESLCAYYEWLFTCEKVRWGHSYRDVFLPAAQVELLADLERNGYIVSCEICEKWLRVKPVIRTTNGLGREFCRCKS
jgi:hypothetical protein